MAFLLIARLALENLLLFSFTWKLEIFLCYTEGITLGRVLHILFKGITCYCFTLFVCH